MLALLYQLLEMRYIVAQSKDGRLDLPRTAFTYTFWHLRDSYFTVFSRVWWGLSKRLTTASPIDERFAFVWVGRGFLFSGTHENAKLQI